MKCAAHPDVETNLRCGKCGKPICPKCLVQTPVGARCRDCARLYKLPTYRVSSGYYLRAIGAGTGTTIVLGFVWGLIAGFLPFIYLNLLLAAGVGYVTGEIISRSVNRKRGTGLAVIAGITVVSCYLVAVLAGILLPWGLRFGLFDLLSIAVGVFMAVNRLR